MKAALPAKKLRRRDGSTFQPEALEPRTLLSAWATVNTFQVATPTNTWGMASDGGGNVYTAGYANDSSGVYHGIIREKSIVNGVSSWSTLEDIPNAKLRGVTTDSAGDVFACGYYTNALTYWIVVERPAGQTNFSVVNDSPTSLANPASYGIALDSSGNVFVVGTAYETAKGSATPHWIVRREAASQLLLGRSAFTTADDFNPTGYGSGAEGVTYIPSGAAAGLYVVGYGGAGSSKSGVPQQWFVRKSTNGGSAWSTVDDFVYASGSSPFAYTVGGDGFGNVYVAGNVLINNGSSGYYHWLTRKSGNGGATWTTVDDFTLSSNTTGYGYVQAHAVGSDAAGNVYVVGESKDNANVSHGVVRTYIGGQWQTIDDYVGPSGGGASDNSFTRDSFGNLYTGGGAFGPTFIRSLPSAPANLTAAAVFGSQINLAWANSAGGDQSGFAIWRSTDGINFTLVTTVGAGTTSFSDTGLSSGQTYYYYVTAILNSVDGTAAGSSGASNTASAST